MSQSTLTTGGATLDATVELLTQLREIDPEMTVTSALALLVVAANPGIAVRSLAEHIDIEGSTASRIAGMLGKYGRAGKDGYKLVDHVDDAQDRRVRRLVLNDRGAKVLTAAFGSLDRLVRRR